jgi:c-di-GMP-binding flagellar brake protein YcgR
MKEMSGKERRKYPRIPVRQAVSIKAAKGLRRGETEDISLGGPLQQHAGSCSSRLDKL